MRLFHTSKSNGEEQEEFLIWLKKSHSEKNWEKTYSKCGPLQKAHGACVYAKEKTIKILDTLVWWKTEKSKWFIKRQKQIEKAAKSVKKNSRGVWPRKTTRVFESERAKIDREETKNMMNLVGFGRLTCDRKSRRRNHKKKANERTN